MARAKYEPLDWNSEETILDAGVAIRQAAMALDVAAYEAVQSKDKDTLANVAALWLKMAEGLEGPEVEEKKDEGPKPNNLGFITSDRDEQID